MARLHNDPRALLGLVGVFFTVLLVVNPICIVYLPQKYDESLQHEDIDSFHHYLRLGVVGELIVICAECCMIPLLYYLFKPASACLSKVAVLLRFVQVVIMCNNVFIYVAAFDSSEKEESKAVLSAHAGGVQLWEFPFGLHLTLLGVLAMMGRSFLGCSARFYGGVLMVAGFGYWLDSVGRFLLPVFMGGDVAGLDNDFNVFGGVLSSVGEVSFFIWILLTRIKEEEWFKMSRGDDVLDQYSSF